MSTAAKLPVFHIVEDAFKFAWRKLPALVLLTFTTLLVFFIPVALLMFGALGSIFAEVAATGTFDQTTEANFTGTSIGLIILAYLLLIIGILLFYATIITQIIRSVIHGERLWLIRINRNTFLYVLATIVVGLLFIPVYFLVAAPIVAGIVAMEAGELSGWVLVPAILAALLIMLFFAVRLSLVPIDVVAKGRFAVGAGFKAGRGNTWRLFGVYLVMFIMILVVEIVALLILMPLSILSPVALSPEVIASAETDPTILMDALAPLMSAPFMIAFFAFWLLLWNFLIGVTYSAPVFAYRHLTETEIEDDSED
jgi:hypothetical protein